MFKFPNDMTKILEVLHYCAHRNNAYIYFYDDLVLYKLTGNEEHLRGQAIKCVISYSESFNTNKFYECLIQHININREIENSPTRYHVVSDGTEIKMQIFKDFDPSNNEHVKHFGNFTIDRIFYDYKSQSIRHPINISVDINIIDNVINPSKWTTEDVLNFALKLGKLPKANIPEKQIEYLKSVSLSVLPDPIEYSLEEYMENILLSNWSGDALKFLTDTFVDGRPWTFQHLVDYMIYLNVDINEESTIDAAFNKKKFDIINLYNNFFLSGKKFTETAGEVSHRLTTTLRLLFDSPNISIPRPYINRIQTMAGGVLGRCCLGVSSSSGITFFGCGDNIEEEECIGLPNNCTPPGTGQCLREHPSFAHIPEANWLIVPDRREWCPDQVCPPSENINCSGAPPIPDCFQNDCDCQGTPPPDSGYCPDGNCLDCTPSECEGPQCCCCSSIDIVLDIRARCYDRIYFSCDITGTKPESGADPFPTECTQCFDACDMALGEGGNTCLDISGHGGNPPPDWWRFPPDIGPCSCTCEDFINPNNPGAGCNLTCVRCQNLKCNADITVTSSNCDYQFNLTPSIGCCGVPAIVDIVFCIDYSGSMTDEIDDVRASVSELADALIITGARARFGLVKFGQAASDGNPIVRFDLSSDVEAFKMALQDSADGSVEPGFDAVETALFHFPWDASENLIFLIGDEPVSAGGAVGGDLGDNTRQPSVDLLIGLANRLGVRVITVQPFGGSILAQDPLRTQLAAGTGGLDLPLEQPFSQAISDLNLNVFGASCNCLDFTPIPAVLCRGGIGPNGECLNPTTDIPIGKCFKDDNSDCDICNESKWFDLCGELVEVRPDPDTLNLVCCGDVSGGGCSCQDSVPSRPGCCGVCDLDICPPVYNTVEAAIEGVWCECWQKAKTGEEGFVIETLGCEHGCILPDPSDPNFDNIANCIIKVPDGEGGFTQISRSDVEAEVRAVWAACDSGDEPIPPSISDLCSPNCNIADECITGSDVIPNDCLSSGTGCKSVRNPATTVLSNGIGLVAYESMEDISVIKIQQFKTSLPGKILPHRKTNFGRLEHQSKWSKDEPKIAKLYYYDENLPSYFITGVEEIPTSGKLVDTLVFRSGPLQNQCFPLFLNPETGVGPIGEDSVGKFISFIVGDAELSNAFPSSDDAYDVIWFIVDIDDKGLIGSFDPGEATIPNSDFLLNESEINAALQLSPHIHNGKAVPVANPSISTLKNYMNHLENSHFVYLVYQALEDKKWNLYMRQLRLSEYSQDEQLSAANATFIDLDDVVGLNNLVYRIVCVNDDCVATKTDFLASRTITMEIVLEDGREVFNQPFLRSNSNWIGLCPGSPSGHFLKKKVFATFTHTAVVDKCPDQFEFNEIFYNWDTGDEFLVSPENLTATELFTLLRKSNDSSIALGNNIQKIGDITITSSRVDAVWYEDRSLAAWQVVSSASFEDLLKYRGLDVSEPIPITEFENGHCTHPIVGVNKNNDVFVTYECTDPEFHQIHITGTAVPTSSLPVGVFNPKNIDTNLDYFLSPDDFIYRANITSFGDSINQLPDMHIDENDVIHLTWQSNRDNWWEIYYAQSENNFEVKRITQFKSRSFKPSISCDNRGNIYIVWHDDRFGNWEILMAYQDNLRTKPLFEQDPYLATVRNSKLGYEHFTDLLPLTLTNNSVNPLCVSDLLVRFYEFRTLQGFAFDVEQSDWPFAFNLPTQDDSTFVTISYPEFTTWISSNETIESEIRQVWKSPSFDAAIQGTRMTTFILSFDNINLLYIRLAAGSFEDQADLSWHQTQWISISHISSGSSVDVEQLITDYAVSSSSNVKGRWRRVDFAAATYPGEDIARINSLEMSFVREGRLCISPGETITGTLDLTPQMRVDKEGVEVVSTPIPQGIEKNKTYFSVVAATTDEGKLFVFPDQKKSISCLSCSGVISTWDMASCSVSFPVTNSTSEDLYYNFRIRFYTNIERTDLITEFNGFFGGDLECFTVDDNKPAHKEWTNGGYLIKSGNTRTIILWPMLSNTAGLLCGIKYWITIEQCSNSNSAIACDLSALSLVSLKRWTCDCGSSRWDNRFEVAPSNIRDMIRWVSSGDGFSDTRITETKSNNFNPSIRIRSDLTGIIIYESNRDDPDLDKIQNDRHYIYASAFQVFPKSNMYATGAEAITSFGEVLVQSDIPISECDGSDCDDIPSAIEGRNPTFSLDQYDNLFLAIEKFNDQTICEEFQENQNRSISVHRCGVNSKNLAFSFRSDDKEQGDAPCAADKIIGQIAPLPQDKANKKIIRVGRVNNDYVQYHVTHNGRPAAVVNQGSIKLEAVVEPEVIAIRARNENNVWSNWFPFSSDITEHTMEIPWELTSGSGIKSVTLQAATYQGLTATFSIVIIADYKSIPYTTKFYRSNDPTAPVPTSDMTDNEMLAMLDNPAFANIFETENLLQELEGIPIAGFRPPSIKDSELVIKTGEFIFLEIKADRNYLEDILHINDTELTESQINDLSPLYDLIQQGSNDKFALPTRYDKEKHTFLGVFSIRVDDKDFNKDGLAFVLPHFKKDNFNTTTLIATNQNYIRDKLNIITTKRSASNNSADIFSNERDLSGNIKYKINIRGTEDPYFVFGDPNYRVEGKQHE